MIDLFFVATEHSGMHSQGYLLEDHVFSTTSHAHTPVIVNQLFPSIGMQGYLPEMYLRLNTYKNKGSHLLNTKQKSTLTSALARQPLPRFVCHA